MGGVERDINNFRVFDDVELAEDSDDPNKTIELCDEALARVPDFLWANFVRAGGYAKLQKWAKAREDCNIILAKLPEFAPMLVLRSIASFALRDAAQAMADANTLERLGDPRAKQRLEAMIKAGFKPPLRPT
jgi:hypothetical protein